MLLTLFLGLHFGLPVAIIRPPDIFAVVEIPNGQPLPPSYDFEKYGFSGGPEIPPPVYDSADIRRLKDMALSYTDTAYANYATVVNALKPNYPLPTTVTILITYRYRQAAAETEGNRIRINSKYALDNSADQGIIVHELTHIVQQYPGDVPRWLAEGTADYVRYYCFEPSENRPIANPETADAKAGYKQTAQFLNWVRDKYASDLVPKLNELLHSGRYDDSDWAKLTGKSLELLASEWKASIRKF